MTDQTDDDANLLDSRQATCLGDVGAPGWHAVVAVGRDGQPATLWLWHADGPDYAHPGEPPPHERLGSYPLPGLALCGQPTVSGRPCQRWVDGRGPCWQHRRGADQRRRTHRQEQR